ncbi:MAG: D-alanine--D-alanine ligase [Firmicutes bacterium HGW-Firmicutes-16]|nr:MAG: D-alanine--D-alanine ligase [Firmicutes bacterium HGW-Firmicutes-16]
MNIVVLCGGISTERDVSITSGTMVAKALRERGHKVVLLDSFFGCTEAYEKPEDLFAREIRQETIPVGEKEPDIEKIKALRNQDNESSLGNNVLEICRAADITFFALHGDEGENGKLQAAFDVAGIKYTGSGYLGSALAMNKSLSKKLFECSGILTPAGITVYAGEAPYADVGFPCVVKPCSGGSSVGTSIVKSREEYDSALELSFKYERAVIVEQYIKGRELTVGVMDGKAMPVIEIIPKEGFYNYKNKYQAGLTTELCPAPISDEITDRVQRLSEKVNSVLMIDAYCRVDYLMNDKGEIFCLEANTLPGMTPTSLIPQMAQAQGKSFGELCDEIIIVSMKKYR